MSQENSKKPINLRKVNALIVTVAIVLSILLIAVSLDAVKSYHENREASHAYSESQLDAVQLQAASDYLTVQVRSFVVNGDKSYLDNYFEEANVTRRRDTALENMAAAFADTETYDYLSAALEYSNELMKTELYAMRLKIESMGIDYDAIPAEMLSVELNPSDLYIGSASQLQKAMNMVFGAEYQGYKGKIYENVQKCSQALITTSQEKDAQSSNHLLTMIRLQALLILFMLVCFFWVVRITSQLAIKPLDSFARKIKEEERLPLIGSEELQFMARTYNEMFEKSAAHQKRLSFEASHDALTGLYNRNVFETERKGLDEDRRAHALLLIDLDYFKEVNDNYGHDVGDAILKKLADLLKASFRSNDYVCRIGGDEFAVIMMGVDSSLTDLVRKKIDNINDKLQNPADGLPTVSITVGVAFEDRENPTGDIFKDADTALYRQKNRHRGGVEFY